jgi:hypothetical protein
VINVQSNLDLRVTLALAEERRARVHRTPLLVERTRERRIVRRWIGRKLVRLGAWVAAEPMHPVRAR